VKIEIERDAEGQPVWTEGGGPHLRIEHDGPHGGGIIMTGPVKGRITLEDGTTYDVTPDFIEHAPGHAEALCEAIRQRHIASGHLPAE
jgi:hypothetical protein